MSKTIFPVLIILFSTGLFAGEKDLSSLNIQARVTDELVDAALALLSSVDEGPTVIEKAVGYSRADLLALPADDNARLDWSYWPRERAGLKLQFMTKEQRAMVHDLLVTTLSSKGYNKLVNIMQLENVLAATEEIGFPRGVEDYVLVFFGRPAKDHPWAWRFEGHHISLNISIVPGKVAVTPSFLGAYPARIINGPLAGFRPIHLEEDLGRQLIRSLSENERKQAILAGEAPWDIVTGNLLKSPAKWDEWKTLLKPDGIPVKNLSPRHQQLIHRIITEIITTYRPEISSSYLEKIDVNELSFAWIGSLEKGAPHYYRLQGQDFVFEYDNSQNDGNHIHTVWRSRTGDFGEHLLGQHYLESHE